MSARMSLNAVSPTVIHSLPDKSVTLLDKGFFGADLLLRIQAEDTDRHWPSRNARAGITELERYGDGAVCCK